MADAFSGSSLTVDRSRQELTDGLVSRLEYSGFLVDAAGGTDPDETMDHNVPASLASMANETGVEVTPDWIRSLALAVTAVDTSGPVVPERCPRDPGVLSVADRLRARR